MTCQRTVLKQTHAIRYAKLGEHTTVSRPTRPREYLTKTGQSLTIFRIRKDSLIPVCNTPNMDSETDAEQEDDNDDFDPKDFYGENHIMSILAVIVFALSVILLTAAIFR